MNSMYKWERHQWYCWL